MILGLAACGAAAERKQSSTTPATQAAQPCPHDVESAARAAWSKQGGQVTAGCVALRSGGRTAWVLEGEWLPVPNPDYVHSAARAVVAPDGRLLWREVDDDINLDTDVTTAGGEAIVLDLDGDGSDEAVSVNGGVDKRGIQRSALVVETVRGGALVSDEIVLEYQDSAREDPPTVCTSTHRLLDAPGGGKRIEVVSTVRNDSRDLCLAPGRHLFRWTGEALVEVPSTSR